jgi:phenylacetate-CoA ligase
VRTLRRLLPRALRAPGTRSRFVRAGLKLGTFKTLNDLATIPVLRKADLPSLQEQAPPFADLLGLPLGRLARIYLSPGPILDPEGDARDYWRFARALAAAGFRKGDLVQNTFAYHLTPAGMMLDLGLRRIGCVVLPAGVGNTEIQADLLRRLPVRGYVGTPAFLLTLLEKARERGGDPRRGLRLRVALVSGGMLSDSLRKTLREDFKVTVRQAYATADLGCVAYECAAQAGMHLDESMVVQVCDPRTGRPVPDGEPGEVVATALNPVYPLIRFGTGDLSILDRSRCSCGRTAPRLTRILGRVDEVPKVRGMFVQPRQVEEALAAFPEVTRFQMVVSHRDHDDVLTVNVVVTGPAAPGLADRITLALREKVKLRATVEVVEAAALPQGAKRVVDLRKWD